MGKNNLPADDHGQKPVQLSPKVKASLSQDHKEVLCVLGYTFIQHQQGGKACSLFAALAVLFPQDIHIKLSLSYAYLMTECPAQALETVSRCLQLLTSNADSTAAKLIKIQALWALDRKDEARQLLHSYCNGSACS